MNLLRHLLIACVVSLASLSAQAQPDPDATLKQQVNAFVDSWHDDAAHARPAFFDKIARDGVYIGTDQHELWKRDDFKVWAKKAFDQPVAWAFTPIQRNVYVAPDKSVIWFDELLKTQMGICRATGILHKSGSSFEIDHYQLSIAVPNEISSKVIEMISDYKAPLGAK